MTLRSPKPLPQEDLPHPLRPWFQPSLQEEQPHPLRPELQPQLQLQWWEQPQPWWPWEQQPCLQLPLLLLLRDSQAE